MKKKRLKGKLIKRVIACGLASVMAVTGVFDSSVMKVSAAGTFDPASIFTATYKDNAYSSVSFKENYVSLLQEAGITEVVIPEVYNDGTNGEAPLTVKSMPAPKQADQYITSITCNQTTNSLSVGSLGVYKKLKRIEFLYPGSEMSLKGSIAWGNTALKQSDSIEAIYFHASAFKEISPEAFRSLNTKDNFRIYVVDQTVKDAIVEATATGEYPVKQEQIEVMASDKKESSLTIACENILFGALNGFEPNVTNKVGDGEITYQLYSDETCKSPINKRYNASNIPIGTYYLQGTIEATTEYKMAKSQPVRVEVLPQPETDKTELNKAITAAEAYYEANKDAYNRGTFDAADTATWQEAFGNVRDRIDGYCGTAKEMVASETAGKYSQDQVDDIVEKLNAAIAKLEDKTEVWNTLQSLITQADAIVAKVERGHV